MVLRRRKNYTKPSPKEQSVVFPYNDNKQFDFETRKHQNTKRLSPWKRIVGNKMLNEYIGDIIDIKKKEKRKEKSVFRILKMSYRDIKNNFKGNKTEKIIVLEFDTPITDTKELKRLIKNFIEKLQRRLGDIIFIRMLLYEEPNQPIIHIWVKTINKAKLEIELDTLKKLWSNGTVRTMEVTRSNIDFRARYCYDTMIKKNLYPTGIKICSTSKNINKIKPLAMDYEEAEKLVIGFKQKYGGVVGFFEENNDIEEEIQQITYEEFVKPEGLKLSKVPITTKYKGTMVKDYKKKRKEKADRNLAEIDKLTIGVKWFKVERLDTDLCKIVFLDGNESAPINTNKTLNFVKNLINKNKFKERRKENNEKNK